MSGPISGDKCSLSYLRLAGSAPITLEPELLGLAFRKPKARNGAPSAESSICALTPREREVMARVVAGFPNKLVGDELGISEITVKAHRGSMMLKMAAESLADLVNMAARLRRLPTDPIRASSP